MKYHFVGVGGIGMSGLARILLQDNIPVSGTDAASGEMVQSLKELGAAISIGHDPKYVPEGASLVVSSGISVDNPEVVHAKKCQLPILHRSDLLHLLMKGKKGLVVAGTHGKTTTTSLLTSVFLHAHLSPSYAIGGILAETDLNGSKGSGEYFIAEADESDGSFLKYEPQGAILTNMDNDHMDHFKTEDNLKQSFKAFASRVKDKKLFFYCIDDPWVCACAFEGTSYGFSPQADLRGLNFRQTEKGIVFDVEFEGKCYADVGAAVIGQHNGLNALAVFGLALKCGIHEPLIREGLAAFKGVKRRAEVKGEILGVKVVDDYGHHPTEIRATLKGLKEAHPYLRLVVLFQPHRFTRTRDCLEEFATCFDDADEVLLTDIYGAGEAPIEGVTAQSILEKVKGKIQYIPQNTFLDQAASLVRPFDLVVTLGAGDITKTGPKLLDEIAKKGLKKYQLGVVFGGQSVEHEVSLKSVVNIVKELDPQIFDLHYFYITQGGYWTFGEEAKVMATFIGNEKMPPECLLKLTSLDVVFPVLHGTYGEDGTIQGFFDILSIPYAGCSHQPSAVCMDKAVTKKLVASAGLLVTPFVDFSQTEWKKNSDQWLKKIQERLSFPVYVKPVHLGSTVGISKVQSFEGVTEAIQWAFSFDQHVLVENEVIGREIEFAVYGNGIAETLPPGEIFAQGQIYDYEAKYGPAGCPVTPKADLEPDLVQKGIEFAKRAYLACGCDGFARVDCFLDRSGNYYLNEINPIPGFTQNSVYPKVIQENGISVKTHLNMIVSIALARHRAREKTRFKRESV